MNANESARQLANEIGDLKRELVKLRTAKKTTVEQKRALTVKINEHIIQAQQNKKERDDFDPKIKELKQKREQLHQTIKEKAKLLKESLKNQKPLPKGKPHTIQEQIEHIENKIETEVVNFEYEKQLMKQLNILKKDLKEAEAINEDYKEINQLVKEIHSIRKESNVCHAAVQSHAQQRQEKHQKFIEQIKQANLLRDQRKQISTQLDKMTQEITQKSDSLDSKIKDVSNIQEEIQKQRKQKNEQAQLAQTKVENEITEKLKRGEKLTTDDLIKLHGNTRNN